MMLEEYAALIRTLAANDGIIAQESYWTSELWRRAFENGFTPLDAWDHERNPALNAM